MATTPLTNCHQCRGWIEDYPHPWSFHARKEDGELDVVVMFCHINCVAAYYKLIPWSGRMPNPGAKIDAPGL